MKKTVEYGMSKLNLTEKTPIMKHPAFIQLLIFSMLAQAGFLAYADTYTSSQDISVEAQQVSSVISGRDVDMNDVTVEGKLIAGRDIQVERCKVSGPITAGRNLELSFCKPVNSITSGHNASLSNTHVQSSVTVGHDLRLNNTILESDTQVGNQVVAESSTIQGPLFLQGHYMKLDNSTADTITFKNPTDNFNIHTSDSIGHVVTKRSHQTVVQVGPNSLSSVNGYTVKGTVNQTTLITPEEAIYVNAQKVSGPGPKTYADYLSAHPTAPQILGPGWPSETPRSSKSQENKYTKKEAELPVNTLELLNHSKIGAAVVFESGYGKILVHPGSEFTGKVTNGRVERLSN